MLVIQCEDELHREPLLGCTFRTERRSVLFTETLHLENVSLSVDRKMLNTIIRPESLNLRNIYADFLCALNLLIW